MAIPIGFEEVKDGECQKGDYIVSVNSLYENYANGLIGVELPNIYFKCYRLVENNKNNDINYIKAEIKFSLGELCNCAPIEISQAIDKHVMRMRELLK